MESSLPTDQALTIVKAWQDSASQEPEAICSTLTRARDPQGQIWLECAGQSLGSEDRLRREMRGLLKLERAETGPLIGPMSLFEAVNHFSEGWSYRWIYAKCKSNILLTPLCEEGIAVLSERMQHLPKDEFTVGI